MEDYASDNSRKLFQSVASSSSKSNQNRETRTNGKIVESKRTKDDKSVSGRDSRKRKPEIETVETEGEHGSTQQDIFDWFDSKADDDFIPSEFQETLVNCNNGPGPSPKRYRR